MPRLDQELVSRGLARSRTQAAKLIAEGAVQIGAVKASKASQQIAAEQHVEVTASLSNRYVSRAAYKLLGALSCFPEVTVPGKTCLDAGASTGGFTQVLLEAGAASVFAVDVGHQQLVPELRDDPRVKVFEGLNVRDLQVSQLGSQAELTVADLSFISLKLVIDALAAATAPGGDLLLMVKPQFEVGKERLAKTGVVSAAAERRRAVSGVAESAVAAGLALRGLATSPLPGQDGNVEYFLWLSRIMPQQSKLGVQQFLAQHWPAEGSPKQAEGTE
ncbi:TlyA family RNA methyltransferase [Psychromicrobium lacuslunae]|uniref:TlyA family RNA methyltransferase n=1 Tax=Psychromicrobium lacuslunae TaxID=1618207 RepID=UPI0009E37ACA|nr:TlyA family RNA methyltransferase [Psychromicrobium lacuslunae]